MAWLSKNQCLCAVGMLLAVLLQNVAFNGDCRNNIGSLWKHLQKNIPYSVDGLE